MSLSANEDIRRTLRANNIPLWRLADKLDCHEQTLVKHFRRELPPDEKQRVVQAINELLSGNGAA